MVQIPGGGENNFLFRFGVVISWLPFTVELIHADAKWRIHDFVRRLEVSWVNSTQGLH